MMPLGAQARVAVSRDGKASRGWLAMVWDIEASAKELIANGSVTCHRLSPAQQYTVTSLCKDNCCKVILDVRIKQSPTNHCILIGVAPLSMDNLIYDDLLENQSNRYKEKSLYCKSSVGAFI